MEDLGKVSLCYLVRNAGNAVCPRLTATMTSWAISGFPNIHDFSGIDESNELDGISMMLTVINQNQKNVRV